jgi:hypothetical protein
MKKTNHKLFATFFIGSIAGWYFLGTTPRPILAAPIAIVWIFMALRDKVSA